MITNRKINEIAKDIYEDWHSSKPRRQWTSGMIASYPYISAMFNMNTITDRYMHDSCESIVLYFLANANTWRGEKARAIKAELKSQLAEIK